MVHFLQNSAGLNIGSSRVDYRGPFNPTIGGWVIGNNVSPPAGGTIGLSNPTGQQIMNDTYLQNDHLSTLRKPPLSIKASPSKTGLASSSKLRCAGSQLLVLVLAVLLV